MALAIQYAHVGRPVVGLAFAALLVHCWLVGGWNRNRGSFGVLLGVIVMVIIIIVYCRKLLIA